MHRSRGMILVALATLAVGYVAAAPEIDIPFKKFVLDNGLTLIVHEDHKAPIVAVNVWYHVGSKNEKPGKTGFAHLFEHLMFNGSEHFNTDYFKAMDRIGATDLNGTTNFDRTNYFQNVPNTALDTVLWLESDRMGHLLGVIDQPRLDEQRGVVQNEKRQGENQPYGRAFLNIFENTYPKGHPYSWSVIGSLEDLDAASLEDVKSWFKTYYGAANAVITVAGDVDAEAVRKSVEQNFGDIPSGPPVERQRSWVARRTGEHRQVMQDRVPQARVYKAWNIPEWGDTDTEHLDLVSDLLTSGKTSRLYERLVYKDQIATDVNSFVYAREIGSLFILSATAQPGQDLAKVEKAIDEEMRRLLADGPTADEMARVRTQNRAEFVRGIERIGGFGGKSDILAQNEVYGGDPSLYKRWLQRVATASEKDLQETAARWLADGAFVLEVSPYPDYKTVETAVDRTKVPEPAGFPPSRFPELSKGTLSNGAKLILARRSAVPVVRIHLMLDAGFAADHSGVPGTASLAMNMMDEGTTTLSSLQISERLAQLGATLNTSSDLDASFVVLSALKENLDPSLEVFADVVLNPAFAEGELNRLKKEQIAAIKREKSTPIQMALRVFPKVLYGEGHPYGMPFTGSGTEESVSGLTAQNLRQFHETWVRPNNATLAIVGDTTLEEITPKLERLLKQWKPKDVPKKAIALVKNPDKSTVYIIDRPDSIQSIIFAGHAAPPKANPDEIAIEAMNEVLGASFTARINMNLREDKHWSYGARSLMPAARGQRPFIVFAPVQTDKTMESMKEIQKELSGIIGAAPPTQEEVAKAKDRNTLSLPGRWETSAAVAGSILEMVQFGLPEDHWNTYPSKVKALDPAKVGAAAKQVLHPNQIIWVVVGDRAKIEAGIQQLALGQIRLMDPDGRLLDRTATARDGK